MRSREGSIDLLRPYVNLTDRDFRDNRHEATITQLEDTPLSACLLEA